MEEKKPWYASKTIWLNAIMMAGVLYQTMTGNQFASAEEQGAIIVVVNFILRLVTKTGLSA